MSRWWWGLLFWCCVMPLAAQAELLALREARASIHIDGQGPVLRELELPYHWDRMHQGQAGTAEFELPFATRPGEVFGPWGIYFPRVGNTAEIWLNDVLLANLGDVLEPNTADFAKGPQYLTIPPLLIRSDNMLRIVLHADGGRRGGLAPPVLGPQREVKALYRENHRARVGASIVIGVMSLLVGGVALALWLTQRDWEHAGRRDPVYLAAALGEFCWALRVGDVMIEHPPLAWPAWGIAVTAVFAGWICCTAWFCHAVAGWHRHRSMVWMRAGLVALFGTSILASYLAFFLLQPIWLTAWLGTANLLFSAYALFYLWRAVHHRENWQRLLVGVVGGLNVAVGVRDWLVIRVSGGLEVNTWLRYSGILFGLALAIIVVVRFRAASVRARDLTRNLTQRVAEKEAELASSYVQMERLAREQAGASERARILRDMHDGVGMHLSTAIRLLRSPTVDPQVLLRTLTDSMDQLKLSIDALQLEPGDVGAMLATLRYRLEPRLSAAGLALVWRVEDMPVLDWMDGQRTRHLQFLLFEAISNVLQHAQAKTLHIIARADADVLEVDVLDDGKGFDAGSVTQRGLRTMRERATAIPASWDVQSNSAGTRVRFRIPRHPQA